MSDDQSAMLRMSEIDTQHSSYHHSDRDKHFAKRLYFEPLMRGILRLRIRTRMLLNIQKFSVCLQLKSKKRNAILTRVGPGISTSSKGTCTS